MNITIGLDPDGVAVNVGKGEDEVEAGSELSLDGRRAHHPASILTAELKVRLRGRERFGEVVSFGAQQRTQLVSLKDVSSADTAPG